ncbi:hypothetical protein BW247_07440 [Acidihalobacter ferrooxydans]|uniref:Uncharacterized protein n=2 Tax=Acidihalobacter ferrooxydans TaxID=1765967 RepID=A0A1P8UGJ6_9GAMM|nr:hypothetical protein BW247_07440 [Acidihalobacter ferrooxydans]
MRVHNKLEDQQLRTGDIRSRIPDQLGPLSFAVQLWQIVRTIITGTLNDLQNTPGHSVDTILQTIDARINEFFIRSLQMETFTMRLEYA